MILNETYQLSNTNYIEFECIKKQIVIGHISGNKDEINARWTSRYNGKFLKTAAFTIDLEGNIYKHFNPIYTSKLLGNAELDKKSIVILLQNEGWLIKNAEKNEFINWIGHIYNKPDEIIERKWRGYSYWAPYTVNQFYATLELVETLCDEFYIPKIAPPNNTKLDPSVINQYGVMYRANIEKHYTDLSPAFKFEAFKYKLETNEKKRID